MLFKCLNNLAPDYLCIFESLEDLDPVELQNTKTDLQPPKVDTTIGRRRFFYHGVKLWNSLDENQKEHPRSNHLKGTSGRKKS